MIALKEYQARVLETLGMFFRQCAKGGQPAVAFQAAQMSNNRSAHPYVPVQAAGLAPEMPYVCLRVPTGGGKTLLACYAAGLAIKDLLRAEIGVVLWLVPSTSILEQTVAALRNPLHAYRRALELTCGPVEVVAIDGALNLSRATVDGQTVVIVATIQSFRVEDPTGRKVYDQNGVFAEHLLNLPPNRLADLLPGADGKPKPSLVNMLRLHRPVVIVDEAHNARTDLSFSTLGALLPSCIVEFTATPARSKHPSNVLHHVSAAELKAASMVKLPLRVITRHPGQRDQLLSDAITLRSSLEKLAIAEGQNTGEYLRPILLIQAENVASCEPLREHLVSQFGVTADEVRISIGSLDELPSAEEVNSPKCPVRIVITVQKLREGWDCPFAYVLCSLRETRSATAIEQIVGRILRLPNAQTKTHPDLNCSYAFSVSPSIVEVLSELRDALESNGFTAAEAERIIIPMPQGILPLGIQPKTVMVSSAEIDETVAQVQMSALAGKVRLDLSSGEITIILPLDAEETEKLASCVRGPEAKARIVQAVALVAAAERAFGGSGATRQPSPYERQLDFLVPLLCVREGKDLFEFETTYLLDRDWQLSECDAALPDIYNPLERPVGEAGEVDVGARGQVLSGVVIPEATGSFVATVQQQVLAFGGAADWSLEGLIGWLDRKIPHTDIPAAQSAEFLRKALRGVISKFGITSIDVLAADRFRLRDELEARIQQHRDAQRSLAFQQFLLPQSALAVSEARSIDFKTMSYEPSWLYEGPFQFRKHYFPRPGELDEKSPGGSLTEEFKCAQFLDALPQVEFWVRNLARKPGAFRLQTSKYAFYPDFVCRLTDGRILAVEYKGAHLYADAEEKRAVGEVWASRSNGRCLFVMPTGSDFSSISSKTRAI